MENINNKGGDLSSHVRASDYTLSVYNLQCAIEPRGSL